MKAAPEYGVWAFGGGGTKAGSTICENASFTHITYRRYKTGRLFTGLSPYYIVRRNTRILAGVSLFFAGFWRDPLQKCVQNVKFWESGGQMLYILRGSVLIYGVKDGTEGGRQSERRTTWSRYH